MPAPDKVRVAVLISGRGSNMVALAEAARDPSFPAEIVLVLSNDPGAEGLARAAALGIPTRAIDHRSYPDRATFDAAIDMALREAGADLICLAGFMRILTDGFVERWAGRMLNIHPSLLPLFKGTHTHAQALAAGVRLHGCTVHFVVPELDAGPIVAQAAVPVHEGDDPDSLAARVIVQERRLYPKALALVAGRRARLDGGRVVIDDPPPDGVLVSL
ncbi:phosphoribosylglycinamide formyltransferase [Methylobacterium persicinum]|uniref:Phosphoribosylglycinamide formyltransferase n=1 Tax=Methylobacterium persicinum TaxID=374426 RepID=A0ABU0HJG8_9HYPH|nr:phosphoribosylglycinamide formyltransferase [Methylobacterium persicinum]MDQ0442455.1 phosphoribosylglycinamide formyltransferase-1 [Methylobacterium persicinum]GJE37909.1 Phosphoribosylglycinamide formyltransferase [Methylobacterium persicinum]